jgi:DNA-binding CsgD family transcriptional regulator
MSFDAVDGRQRPHTVGDVAHWLWALAPTEEPTSAIWREAQTLVEQLGYRYFHLTYRFAIAGHGTTHGVLSNTPDPWRRRYETKGYLRIDPILQQMLVAYRPFLWNELPRDLLVHRDYFADAARHGLHDGLSGAIRFGGDEIGLFTLATPNGDPDFACETAMAHMQLFVTRSFEQMRERELARLDAPCIVLTCRQAEVLRSVLYGLSAKQTADHLGISQTMVERHLETVRRKLGVRSSSAAAHKAVALRLIEPYAPLPRPTARHN